MLEKRRTIVDCAAATRAICFALRGGCGPLGEATTNVMNVIKKGLRGVLGNGSNVQEVDKIEK